METLCFPSACSSPFGTRHNGPNHCIFPFGSKHFLEDIWSPFCCSIWLAYDAILATYELPLGYTSVVKQRRIFCTSLVMSGMAIIFTTLLMVDRTSHRGLLIVVHSVFSGETVMTFLHQFSGVMGVRYLYQFSGETVMTFLHHNSSGEQKWLSWHT